MQHGPRVCMYIYIYVEKMDFSGSALAEHAWKHDHHIDWTSACILDVESHYRSRLSREAIHICRQPFSLNRDRAEEVGHMNY